MIWDNFYPYRGAFAAVLLGIIVIYTIRCCVFCWTAFSNRDDSAGTWLAISETTAALAWCVLVLDIVFWRFELPIWLLGLTFWSAAILKAVSQVLKSELGYKAIARAYQLYQRQLEGR
jgi:hypothetical protein